MKKIWTKFKHWLIRKLGGYTMPVGAINVSTSRYDVLTLESRVAVMEPSFRGFDNFNCNRVEWFKDNFSRDMIHLKSALAKEIVEMDDEIIDITHDWDPILNQVVVRARIRIVKNK